MYDPLPPDTKGLYTPDVNFSSALSNERLLDFIHELIVNSTAKHQRHLLYQSNLDFLENNSMCNVNN